MNILAALNDPSLFKPHFRDLTTWAAWRAFLATLFALPMSEAEADLFRACTARASLPQQSFKEATLICGRRSGKSRVLALIATFLALFHDWKPMLSPGETGFVVIVACDRKQARAILNYCRAFISRTPLLAAKLRRETQE